MASLAARHPSSGAGADEGGFIDEGIYAKTLNPLDDFDHDVEDDPDTTSEWKEAPPRVEWFHGQITREDASKLLIQRAEASYLVRESVRDEGNFSISFRVATGVKHFKIIRHAYGDFFVADNRFATLEEVVAHYSNENLCDDLQLQHPVPPTAPGSSAEVQRSVVALVSVSGDGLTELSCTQGERLTVLNNDDENWIFCSQHNGARCGFVPKTCVKFMEAKHSQFEAEAIAKLPSNFSRSHWIHGKIDRSEAEQLLERDGTVGSFLVRASGDTGSYSLSFRGPKKIQHFRIKCLGENKYECGGRDFSCLEALVLRYYKEPLMDGLTLNKPLGSKVMPEQRYDVDGELYSDVQAIQKALKSPPKPRPIYERRSEALSGGKGKSGYIVKKSRKSKKWKSLFFVLDTNSRRLEYFDDDKSFKPKGLLDLESATIFPLDNSYFGRPNCFQIIVQSSEVFLCCNTESEKTAWMAALAEYCGQCGYGKITTDASVRTHNKRLDLTVVEAKNFGTKFASPYCIVMLNSVKIARTPVMPSKTGNPFWSEDFTFDNLSDAVSSVTVVLCNRTRGMKDKEIATISIPFTDFTKSPEMDAWFDMVSDGANSGSMRLKAAYVNDVLLPLNDYSPLTKLLVDPSVETPLLMAKVLKGQLNVLSKNLLRVWIATGNVNSFLDAVLTKDIAKETKVATLFRGNSLGTKCMDQFMKITAMPFLHEAISSAVKKLFEDKRSCELDPSRKGSESNLGVLLEHVVSVMNGIKAAARNCPLELRTALQAVREKTTKQFPNEPNVQYTSVSAFVFLRLICPAILNPKLFNMMPDLPSEALQRNLTLVAKVVQNMANMAEFGVKEAYMHVCNPHIAQQRSHVQQLLANLSSTGATPSHKTSASDAVMSQHAHANLLRQCNKRFADFKNVPESKALVSAIESLPL